MKGPIKYVDSSVVIVIAVIVLLVIVVLLHAETWGCGHLCQ